MIPARVLWDAAWRGTAAFAAAAGAGFLVGALELLALPVSAADAFASGGLWFLMFHHTAVSVQLPPLPGAATTVLSFGAALMLGTLLAGWLLFLAGRATTRPLRGSWIRAVGAGSLVAIPYASLSFVLALVIRAAPPEVPATLTPPGVRALLGPSPLSALFWTLGLGLLCGGLGGLVGGGPSREAPVRAALAGGWRMAWTAVALSFTGLLVVAALHPQAIRAYFEGAFAEGPGRGSLVLVGTAMVVPDASISVFAAAMGGSLRLEVLGQSCTLLSYARFPVAVDGPGALAARACGRGLGGTPPGYYLFLLVPLVSTLMGGHLAARRAGLHASRTAAVVGAEAGVIGATLVTGLMVMARVTVEASGPAATFLPGASVGPELALGFALTLLWGGVGGAAGGVLATGRATGPGKTRARG